MFEQYLEDFAVGQTFSSGCLRIDEERINEYWGVANFYSLMQEIGTAAPSS